jgi:hypothetical protein
MQKVNEIPIEPEQKFSLFSRTPVEQVKPVAVKLVQKVEEPVLKKPVEQEVKSTSPSLFAKKVENVSPAPVAVEVKKEVEQKVVLPVPIKRDDTPVYMSIDSCEDIIFELNAVRDSISGKRDIRHQIIELQKKEDDVFGVWKNSLEGIQTVISRIDKKMFKQVI